MFSFLHLADPHLDSPLKGLDRYEGAPADEIRQATRQAFENAISLALRQQVKFVLLAGDVYDGDWKDYNTGLYFIRQAARLREAGIPLVVIAGNHDAANRMTLSLKLPDNVHYLSSKQPQTLHLEDVGVAIHGQGFATAAVHDDLSANYPPAVRGCLNIGLLHTCASGRAGHERYAPCTVEGLRAKEYDYWALGHIHTREVLCREPHIIFPGNPQGRHIRETGEKGCVLVEVGSSGQLNPVFHGLDVLRWELIDIELGPQAAPAAATFDEVLALVAARLTAVKSAAGDRTLAARVELRGTTELHARLLADTRRLTNEIRSQAITVGAGSIWLEKVVVRTQPVAAPQTLIADGPLGEIAALAAELRGGTFDLGDELAELLRKLPPECLDDQWLESAEGQAALLAEAESMVLTQLLGKDDPS